MKKHINFCIALLLFFTINNITAQETSKAKDSTKKATKELPLEPERKNQFYH